MKNLQKVVIVVSILALGNYSYASNIEEPTTTFDANLQRYYGNSTSPNSYIDTNQDSNMSSYIIINPFTNNIPSDNSLQYSHIAGSNKKHFQPADGSLTTGIYDTSTQTAQTALHRYKNIVIVDGTVKPPQLNSSAQYIDKHGNKLKMIGSLIEPSQDASDNFIYYFFGKLDDPKDYDLKAKKAANIPMQTYSSQGE